jgi:hypothetical protein
VGKTKSDVERLDLKKLNKIKVKERSIKVLSMFVDLGSS